MTVILISIINLLGQFALKLGSIVGNLYTKGWGFLNISWFDHLFDHLRGPSNWHWYERGILGCRIIKPDDIVLDICCGDGIYSGLFYSQKAKFVDAVDRDDHALSYAKRRYRRDNVQFHKVDVINEGFHKRIYDVVFLFAAIEHFSIENGMKLLQKIANVLVTSKNGTFFGSTPIFQERGGTTLNMITNLCRPGN